VAVDFAARAAGLVAGPRGRALCAAAIGLNSHVLLRAFTRPLGAEALARIERDNAGQPGWPPPGWAELDRRPTDGSGGVVTVIDRQLADSDLAGLGAATDAVALLRPLSDAVNGWAFSDDQIQAAVALADGADALLPVAEALARAPGAAWWWDPAPAEGHRWVAWSYQPPGPPPLGRTAEGLRTWHDNDTSAEARAADMVPFPPTGTGPRYSGIWWSAPRAAGILGTTRAVGELPAAALALSEDEGGYEAAEIWDIGVDPSVEVYEVDSPDAWCTLVDTWPREVTLSRRHDWWRWTGSEGPWLLPDWTEVAEHYDGIHLSVAAHLQASYRPLPVSRGTNTCIAGWDPDETIWLRDACRSATLVAHLEEGSVARILLQPSPPLGGRT
jgi:hypothetical protein